MVCYKTKYENKKKKLYSKTCLKPIPVGTEEFVPFRQMFGLRRFKLHRHLVDGTADLAKFLRLSCLTFGQTN